MGTIQYKKFLTERESLKPLENRNIMNGSENILETKQKIIFFFYFM